MRWSGPRRLREAGGCIDRGMGGMRQGCVAGAGWPRGAGPALGCSERQCAGKGSEALEGISGRHDASQPPELSRVASPHRGPPLHVSGLWL